MRYLKTFGLIVLTAAFWNSGASAQNAPSGSYQQSCRNVGTNGSTLYANCRNSYGEWQSVTLPDFQRCRGDIGNDNGTLRCDMRGNDYQPAPQNNWQNGVPAGSYAQTCRDISVNGSTLEATCQQRNSDNWTRTALQNFNQCTSGIENIDGQLECTKANYNQGYGQGDRRDNGQGYGQGDRRDNGQGYGRNYENDVPDGAYTQNCRNIRISGSTLLATCQLRNGRWRQASLRYYNQCTSEIENYNGRLVCRR
jgi:hypothetical protein